jgi:hypothetical protein
MAKKKKKHSPNLMRKDYHHILFQGRHWKQGWAKILREHKYCGGYIPQDTLHREIHSKIHDIPTPNGSECRKAVEALNSWLDAGYISLDDPIERKIEMIAKCFRANCPATTAILDWQREVVIKFYQRG